MTFSAQPMLHPVFEVLGYLSAFTLYRRACRRSGEVVEDGQHWLVIAAAAVGALLGSRILGLLEQAPLLHLTWRSVVLPGGRTIVGGLLGGWMAVELVKRRHGIHSRTGDLFAAPLCIGIAVGRIGCFLAGVADGTYGRPTRLPWGVDFGDGPNRHPTQIYEIVFLLALAWMLRRYPSNRYREGTTFRLFLAGYLGWRLAIDFIKPEPLIHGLSLIQWACLAGLLALLPALVRFCPVDLDAMRSTR